VPLEQGRTNLHLKRFDSVRDIRLHRVEFAGRARNAAAPRHRRECKKIGKLHGIRPFRIRDGYILNKSFIENGIEL
jgi:hypothetical protein